MMKYLLLFFFTTITFAQSKKFVPIDEEVLEFISEVNYTLYANKKPVFFGLTSKDTVTHLPNNVVFDSIAFKKLNYKETGFKKDSLKNIIVLKKTAYELDEIIISNTKLKEIVIGEKSRFVKRKSNSFEKEMVYGLLFRETELKNKTIKKMNFFVEKVKYKTTYKIKFYAAHETGDFITVENLNIDELLFESPILTLEVGTKNKVEVNLEEYNINTANTNVFVCLELQAYYDENNNIVQPQFKEATKLKFQLSQLVDYYAKTSDQYSKKLSDSMININMMINRDFAFMFYKKPSKSELVAPAIILYATENK